MTASNHTAAERDDSFQRRHIGPSASEQEQMLERVGHESLDALVAATIPDNIRFRGKLNLPEPTSE